MPECDGDLGKGTTVVSAEPKRCHSLSQNHASSTGAQPANTYDMRCRYHGGKGFATLVFIALAAPS